MTNTENSTTASLPEVERSILALLDDLGLAKLVEITGNLPYPPQETVDALSRLYRDGLVASDAKHWWRADLLEGAR